MHWKLLHDNVNNSIYVLHRCIREVIGKTTSFGVARAVRLLNTSRSLTRRREST